MVSRTMLMWGQPPSAVLASGARRGFLSSFPNLKLVKNFYRLPKPHPPQFLLDFKQSGASLRRTAEGGCPHINPMPQAFYRRQLPHLQCDDRQHFVTFCTDRRWVLPERDVRLCWNVVCTTTERSSISVVAVVMPDHVHMIFTPLVNQQAMEIYSLAEIMDAVKGASAHGVNRALGRKDGYGRRNRLTMCCVLLRVSTRRSFIC